VIQAIVLIFAGSYVAFNLPADILTVLVSPTLRTRYRR
jgi:ABC-type dipeptide/oligopeptide/nickel transport system permease component